MIARLTMHLLERPMERYTPWDIFRRGWHPRLSAGIELGNPERKTGFDFNGVDVLGVNSEELAASVERAQEVVERRGRCRR
jgi:hypothetical protein